MAAASDEFDDSDFEEENTVCCSGSACCNKDGQPVYSISGMKRFAIILCFPTPKTSCCSLISWVVGCSNFSAQYNYNSITLALMMLERAGKNVPDWATSSLTSVIFLGSVFGQLSLGFLGDAAGREVGLAITLTLIIGGAFLSAVAWDYETEPSTSVYVTIVCARFVLGVGVGGVYPLSATAAFEDTRGGGDAGSTLERAKGAVRASWGLFWQMPGQAAVYVIALILVGLDGLAWTTRARLLLLSGAVPAAFALPAALTAALGREAQTPRPSDSRPRRGRGGEGDGVVKKPLLGDPYAPTAAAERMELFLTPGTLRRLAGCCAAWFLFDVYAYGISVYSPVILEWIFGDSEALSLDCWQNLLCSVVGFPAVALSIWLLDRAYDGDVARIQTLGFTLSAGSFVFLSIAWLLAAPKSVLFGIYIALRAVIVFGVAVSTFVMPAVLFPARIRSTCNGAAAASGKLGALVGTMMTMPVANISTIALFLGFGLVALAGAALTSSLLQADFVKKDPSRDTQRPRKSRDEATGLLGGAGA